MNVTIPKYDHQKKNHPAWMQGVTPGGQKLKPTIVCKCGEHLDIEKHHVHPDGRVTASFLHPACGWHVFLTLEDYSGGEFKPE